MGFDLINVPLTAGHKLRFPQYPIHPCYVTGLNCGEGQAGEEWWEWLKQEGPPSLADLLRICMDGGVQQSRLTTTFTAIEV